MKEILIIAAPVLILAIFVALIAFCSFLFWRWQNDAKRHDLRRANSTNQLTGNTTRALADDICSPKWLEVERTFARELDVTNGKRVVETVAEIEGMRGLAPKPFNGDVQKPHTSIMRGGRPRFGMRQ